MKKYFLIGLSVHNLLASGVWFQAEHTVLREVMGFADRYVKSNSNLTNYNRLWELTKPINQFQVIYGGGNESAYFRPIYMAGNGRSGVPTCKDAARQSGNCISEITGCIKKDGNQLCGIVGYQDNKKRIQPWEDIYFSIALLRDKTQIHNLLFPNINSGVNAAEIGPYNHGLLDNSGYLDDLLDYYGLQPYYTNFGTNNHLKPELGWGGSGDGIDINNQKVKITRYDLSNSDWKKYTLVNAYVEKIPNSNNFIRLNQQAKQYGFAKLLPHPGNFSSNLLRGKYAPEVVGTDNSTYALRSSANFTVKTMKHCKQRVLYEIKVKRIVIPGKYRDFTIYDAYGYSDSLHCREKTNKIKTDENFSKNDTWWGYWDGINTCTSDNRWQTWGQNNKWSNMLKDYTHERAPEFSFYVIQEGDPNGDDCLDEKINAKISSVFIDSIQGEKINFKPIVANDIYTYVEGEDVFLKLDFSSKNITDPFDANHQRFISINMNNRQFDYYIQKNCIGFNDNSCKYQKIEYKANPTDFEIQKGTVAFDYNAYCSYIKKTNPYINCDATKHKNEIFFKFNNAIIKFKNIKASKDDYGRRNFQIRYYSIIDDTQREELPHTPISVRPKYLQINQELCHIAQDCNNPLSINLSGSNQTITENKLYINQYALGINYPGDSLNPRENFYINLAYNNSKINSLVEIEPDIIYNNFKPIVLFDAPTITSIVVKDLHIKKYFDKLGKNYKEYCNDYGDITDIIKANTRDKNGKIACSTPVKLKHSGASTSKVFIKYKDNIDKDAKFNVVISNINKSKNFPHGYNFYPQIIVKSYNNEAVAKYFTDDVVINFIPKFSRPDVALSDFYIIKNTGKDIINRIDKTTNNFSVSLNKDKLNDNFVDMVRTLSNSGKTTFDLLNYYITKNYISIKRYKAQEKLDQRKKIFELDNNQYEIPLEINYTKQAPLFTLDSMNITMLSSKDFASNLTRNEDDINVAFLSAMPSFSDISINVIDEGVQASWDVSNTKLRYLSQNSTLENFIYDKKTANQWSNICNTTPCLDKVQVIDKSTTLPGFDANFISDYGLDIIKTPRKLTIKNTKLQNTSYVKDLIHCLGGIYNCDTTFTLEFK